MNKRIKLLGWFNKKKKKNTDRAASSGLFVHAGTNTVIPYDLGAKLSFLHTVGCFFIYFFLFLKENPFEAPARLRTDLSLRLTFTDLQPVHYNLPSLYGMKRKQGNYANERGNN